MVNWIKKRMKERTSWDGAVCVALGLMILFLTPIAKIAAGLAIAYGVWTIWKSEYQKGRLWLKRKRMEWS